MVPEPAEHPAILDHYVSALHILIRLRRSTAAQFACQIPLELVLERALHRIQDNRLDPGMSQAVMSLK